MAYLPAYSPFGPPYVADPWQTTFVPRYYPEHHHMLEHTRHALSAALREVGHSFQPYGTMISPVTDVHETEANYYLDVELPGVSGVDKTTLKWIGLRTLLLRVNVAREPLPEDTPPEAGDSSSTENAQPKIVTANKETAEDETDKAVKKASDEAPKVHQTVSERRLGHFGRSFNFLVDVDHDGTVAKLNAGVLRLTVPKADNEPKVDKDVKIQAGA